MTYETKQELRDEIATLHDVIREMAGPPLSKIERTVLKGAFDNRSQQSIADQYGIQKASVSKIAHKLRRRGLPLPNWPNFKYGPKLLPRRFQAAGTTPGGSRVSCAADTQEHADDHIAALVVP